MSTRTIMLAGSAAVLAAAAWFATRRSGMGTTATAPSYPAQGEPPPQGQGPAGWTQVASFDNTTIFKDPTGQILTWTGRLAIDADGSPFAYGPKGGLDYLANAGHPGNWYGIATVDGKKTGEPVIQGSGDPNPGGYVSTTALADHKYPSGDPRRYVDSQKIPFLSLPPEILDLGVKLGDVCAVEYDGKVVFCEVADVGPRRKIGEGSMALAQGLGFNSDPKSHQTRTGLRTYAFCNSGQKRPLTVDEINAIAAPLYARLGGGPAVVGSGFDVLGTEEIGEAEETDS